MRRTHLAVQAGVILSLVAFVGWPAFRPVRAQSIWRYAPEAVLQTRTLDAARFAGESAAGSSHSSELTTRGQLNTLLGVARTSLNASIPYARILLRNVRTGAVVAETVAIADGQFALFDVDNDTYVIEILNSDGSVVATSIVTNMAPGELRRTEIRVPSSANAVAASLAHTLDATAPRAIRAAHDAGVTRTTATAVAQVSPR